ncbi:MAG: hypothetical protein K1X53_04635 [Candidatus Sumerlaeaceae bacterium]|nr:hypothetical protein [Candidatus Sumerlaeaceae bacterium]
MPRLDMSPTEVFLTRHTHDILAGSLATAFCFAMIALVFHYRWWTRLGAKLAHGAPVGVLFPFPLFASSARILVGSLSTFAFWWLTNQFAGYTCLLPPISVGLLQMPFFLLALAELAVLLQPSTATTAVILESEFVRIYGVTGIPDWFLLQSIHGIETQTDRRQLIKEVRFDRRQPTSASAGANTKPGEVDLFSLPGLRLLGRLMGVWTVRPIRHRSPDVQQSLQTLLLLVETSLAKTHSGSLDPSPMTDKLAITDGGRRSAYFCPPYGWLFLTTSVLCSLAFGIPTYFDTMSPSEGIAAGLGFGLLCGVLFTAMFAVGLFQFREPGRAVEMGLASTLSFVVSRKALLAGALIFVTLGALIATFPPFAERGPSMVAPIEWRGFAPAWKPPNPIHNGGTIERHSMLIAEWSGAIAFAFMAVLALSPRQRR